MRKSSFIIFLLVASLGSSAVAFARGGGGGGGGGGMGGYGQGNQSMANPGGEIQERNKIMEQNRTDSQVQQPSGNQSKSQALQQTEKQTRD